MKSRFCHVTGRFLAPTGLDDEPLSGSVTFRARATSVITAHATYLPAPVTVELAEDGTLEADLLAPTKETQPIDWTWEVVASFRYRGAPVPWKCFDFAPVAGKTLDLGRVAPVPDPVTGDYVTRGEPGTPGTTPEISIGQVQAVPASQAGVTITGPAEAPVLDFALPTGRLGWTGDRGPQGLPGAPGPVGPAGTGIENLVVVGGGLKVTTTDGSVRLLPYPTGLLGPGAPGAVTRKMDGVGLAVGHLIFEDSSDGTGRVRASVSRIVGEPGATGPAGPAGPRGEQGPPGPPGEAASIPDTGWLDVSEAIAPPAQFPPQSVFIVRRQGDMVAFQVAVPESASADLIGAAWGAFGEPMPAGFRPRWGGSLVLRGRAGSSGMVSVKPTGSIVWSGQGLDRRYGVHAVAFWPTADQWPISLPGTAVS